MKLWVLSLPYKTNKEVAEEYGLALSTVSNKRGKLGIPTVRKWDHYKHLLGVIPDAELAKRMGIRSNAVTVKRHREGISPPRNHNKEAKLQGEFVKTLGEYEEYIHTPYGEIDILTKDTIYECKSKADLSHIHMAVGQLLMYSNAYPDRELVIVAPRIGAKPHIVDAINKLDIQIITFD